MRIKSFSLKYKSIVDYTNKETGVISIDAYGFGEKIKDLRITRNLSQEEVAKRVSLTKSTISGYERGIKSPSVEAVINLALFFNVSTDYLLGVSNRNVVRVKDFTLEDEKEFLRIFNAIEDFVQHKNDTK